jgi:hypothetical protein
MPVQEQGRRRGKRQATAARQAGLSLFGLLLWAIIIGFIGLVLVRAVPTMNEYFTIKRAVQKLASGGPTTVPEIRNAFDKQKEIEYSIQSVSGKDLEITKENDRVVIRFAYDKELELVSPVFLLIKYQGSSQ